MTNSRTSKHSSPHRRAALGLILALLVIPGVARASATSTDTLDLSVRTKIVHDLHDLVRDRFAHWEGVPGFRFEERFAGYARSALASPGRREFSMLTREFIASLQNGHTTFADTWMLAVDPGRLPFSLGWLGGEWVVLSSRLSGLGVGDVVTSVDGRPAEALYRSLAPYLSASNDRARRRQFTARGFLWPAAFDLGTGDGRALRATRSPAPPLAEEVAVHDRWLVPDSIAYLAVPSFDGDEYEERALELVRGRYLHAPAMILDLRGNGGGNTPRTLIKTLLDGRPYAWWKEDPNRLPMSAFDQMAAALRRTGSVTPTYRGTLVLITDGGCASACEDFVLPLSWTKRAMVVGDTTAGTTGQPVFASFADGITISVSAKRAHFPDGSAFEGVGIAPDVLVLPARTDLTSGLDRALEAAMAVARRRATGTQ